MDSHPDSRPALPRSRVPLYLAVSVFVLLFASGIGAYFAVQAADAADDEILSDGVDRSRLPREQAVALAELARRSDGIPLDTDQHHDHGSHGEEAHLAPEQRETLDAQLAMAAALVPRLDTPEEAAAQGYVQASGESDGVGSHWVNWSIVDRPFDPEAPSMLLFDELKWGHGPELIAFSYWVASADTPEGFAGHTDEWHRHLGMCFENGWLTTDNWPSEKCDGDWIHGGDLWMLHAWIVPGVENKAGIFETVNQRLCERACGLEN